MVMLQEEQAAALTLQMVQHALPSILTGREIFTSVRASNVAATPEPGNGPL
jgi:hypothetical protein